MSMSEKITAPYMEEFADYLREIDGLAPRTIKRHMINATDFIYYMSTHGYEADPDCKEGELPMDKALLKQGGEFIGMYFSYFLPQKAFATKDDMRKSTGSVKKLYKFLAAKGIVSDTVCQEISEDIKFDLPLWLEDCE